MTNWIAKLVLVIPATYYYLHANDYPYSLGQFSYNAEGELGGGDGSGEGSPVYSGKALKEPYGTYTGWQHYMYIYVIASRDDWWYRL